MISALAPPLREVTENPPTPISPGVGGFSLCGGYFARNCSPSRTTAFVRQSPRWFTPTRSLGGPLLLFYAGPLTVAITASDSQ